MRNRIRLGVEALERAPQLLAQRLALADGRAVIVLVDQQELARGVVVVLGIDKRNRAPDHV